SRRMAQIRGKNTKPEIALRKVLHAHGLRYRLHGAGLPGKPDLVFKRYRTVVFVHGCFWHRHADCPIATIPKSNTQFWLDKFNRNIARDRRIVRELEKLGWNVLIAWERSLNSQSKSQETGDRMADLIRNARPLSK